MDLSNDVTTDLVSSLAKANGGARITGLESDKIYFQAGSYFFVGELDETVGESMIFEVEESKFENSGLFPLLNSMKYNKEDKQKLAHIKTTFACKTTRVIMMDKVDLVTTDVHNTEKDMEIDDPTTTSNAFSKYLAE
ncbi:hypothetical protein CLU79DRAFT_746092 [Phycomyces nitens]|nr:hypothetical protein CLU79DRAFT_746092 [Phycomyces nitens]